MRTARGRSARRARRTPPGGGEPAPRAAGRRTRVAAPRARPSVLRPVRDGSRGAQGRQYEYLLELLARLADASPVVLIVEDIHWADPSTLDFLSFVARNARGERILLVATHRLHDGRDLQALERYIDQLERAPAVETVSLDPLTELQVSEQIEAILMRPADATITRRITARTQGNPFYVEELIAHGDTAEAPLPAGQAATLLERVWTLSPETQHVLQVLAAFGRAIEHDLARGSRRDRGARAVATAPDSRGLARDRRRRRDADVPSRPHPRGGLRRAAPGRAPAPARRRGRRAEQTPRPDRRRRARGPVARRRQAHRGVHRIAGSGPRRDRACTPTTRP